MWLLFAVVAMFAPGLRSDCAFDEKRVGLASLWLSGGLHGIRLRGALRDVVVCLFASPFYFRLWLLVCLFVCLHGCLLVCLFACYVNNKEGK